MSSRFAKLSLKIDVLESLRDDTSRSEPVRREALSLAESYSVDPIAEGECSPTGADGTRRPPSMLGLLAAGPRTAQIPFRAGCPTPGDGRRRGIRFDLPIYERSASQEQ